MAYTVSTISMTLSDLEGYAPNSGLCKCDFSHSCPGVDKILTDM